MNKRIVGFAASRSLRPAAIYFAVACSGDSRARSRRGRARSACRSVEVATAVQKKAPVRLDALGYGHADCECRGQSRGSTAKSSRCILPTARMVKQGDVLVRLDRRRLEAQMQAAEGVVARDQAQLEGAERDVRRYTDLVRQERNPDHQSRQRQDAGRRSHRRPQGRTRRSCKISKFSSATDDPGADQRPHQRRDASRSEILCVSADMTPDRDHHSDAPIYVTFSVAASALPDIRKALAAETATVEAIIPGEKRRRQRRGDHDREYGRCRRPGWSRCARRCPTPTNCFGRHARDRAH